MKAPVVLAFQTVAALLTLPVLPVLAAGPALAQTRCAITYSKDFGSALPVGELSVGPKNWLASVKVPLDASYGYTREVTIALILTLPTPPSMEITLYNNAGKEGRGSMSVPPLRAGQRGKFTFSIHNHGENEPSFEQIDADCRAAAMPQRR